MNLTKFSPPCHHFGITIFQQELRKRRNGGSLCIKHGTSLIIVSHITAHVISNGILSYHTIIPSCITHHLMSRPILSYCVLFYPILSYPIISHQIKLQHIKPPSSLLEVSWNLPRPQSLLLISKAHKLRIKVIN